MFGTNRSHIAISLVLLTLMGDAATGRTGPAEQPSPDVPKLLAQLKSTDFRTRTEASDKLEKLGGPVLPALRKALTTQTEVEAKRRIEFVIDRIENALLQAEEKLWQDL